MKKLWQGKPFYGTPVCMLLTNFPDVRPGYLIRIDNLNLIGHYITNIFQIITIQFCQAQPKPQLSPSCAEPYWLRLPQFESDGVRKTLIDYNLLRSPGSTQHEPNWIGLTQLYWHLSIFAQLLCLLIVNSYILTMAESTVGRFPPSPFPALLKLQHLLVFH